MSVPRTVRNMKNRTSYGHSSSNNETACLGITTSRLALPASTDTVAAESIIVVNFPAASSSAYCGREGASGEPSRFHAL